MTICFFGEDLVHVTTPCNDALVIMIEVKGLDMKRILVEVGSLPNIMFLEAFDKFGKAKEKLKKVDYPSSY